MVAIMSSIKNRKSWRWQLCRISWVRRRKNFVWPVKWRVKWWNGRISRMSAVISRVSRKGSHAWQSIRWKIKPRKVQSGWMMSMRRKWLPCKVRLPAFRMWFPICGHFRQISILPICTPARFWSLRIRSISVTLLPAYGSHLWIFRSGVATVFISQEIMGAEKRPWSNCC